MPIKTTYPAKLLLFGEYTVILGAKGIALPLAHFKGQWQTSKGGKNIEKQQGLWKLLAHIKETAPFSYDIFAFEEALTNGTYFASDIPQGYGVGSSGAVCAAVYDRFAVREISLGNTAVLYELKKDLAHLESCFHGASSGTDPLVCFLNKGIILQNAEILQLTQGEQANLDGFFLIDTGLSRKTEPLVHLFKSWCKEEIYPMRLEVELIPLVEDAIDAFLTKESTELLELIHQISYFQFKYFSDMIPKAFRSVWLDALASKHTKLKLCGAGGGGFILGFSTDLPQTRQLLSGCQLLFLGNG